MAGAGYPQQTLELERLSRYFQESRPNAFYELAERLKWGLFGSTIHLVSNCEDVTDWDISSSSDFNAVDETTVKLVGSTSMELVDVSTTKGTYIALDSAHKPDNEDWSDFNWICMLVCDDTNLRRENELMIQIMNNNVWSKEIAVPVCQTASMFEMKCIDISDLQRSKVNGFRFVNRRGTGSSEKVYIDQIVVTDLITGNGNGDQVSVGPVIGSVRVFPVETGATIRPGDTVEWSAFGVALGTANDARIIGVACQHDPYDVVTATDSSPKEILVATEGSIVWMRGSGTGVAAGEPILLGSDVINEAAGTATSNAEYGFGMALMNGAGTYSSSGDIACQIVQSTTED